MAVPVNIFIKDSQLIPAPIQGVVVNIYDPITFAFISTATSDSSGMAAFLLPGTTVPGTSYEVRFYKLGVAFANPTQIQVLEPVSPPNTNNFDFTGTVFVAAAPTDPRVCRCTGLFVDFGNRPVPNALVRIMALSESGFQNPKVVDANLVSPSVQEFHTDSNGRLVVDLLRMGEYYITFSGEDETVWNVHVPDRPLVNLIDLIHPQPVSLNWNMSLVPSFAATITVGQTFLVDFTVTFSDYEIVTDSLSKWITITNSDGSIVNLGLVSTSSSAFISMTGLKPGVITVTTTANQVFPKRIPTYSINAPTLTITVI